MSRPEEPPDELQKIWREDHDNAGTEEVSMVARLAREKHRSFQDLVRGQNLAEYIVSLSFAPLTAFAAWKARPLLVMQLGCLIMTATLIAGAAIVWVNGRGILIELDLSVREYLRQLLRLYDRRIRFLKSSKYYAVPLFFGASLACIPAVTRFLPGPWGIVLLSALILAAWIWVWYTYDVRRVTDLRLRKDEVRRLLEEMDRE